MKALLSHLKANSDNSDADGNRLSEGLAVGLAEGHHDRVDLVSIGVHVGSHLERNLEGAGGFAHDALLHRNGKDIDWELRLVLLVARSDCAVEFPGPVGVVEDFDLGDGRRILSDRDHFFRLASADGTCFSPIVSAPDVFVSVGSFVLDRVPLGTE